MRRFGAQLLQQGLEARIGLSPVPEGRLLRLEGHAHTVGIEGDQLPQGRRLPLIDQAPGHRLLPDDLADYILIVGGNDGSILCCYLLRGRCVIQRLVEVIPGDILDPPGNQLCPLQYPGKPHGLHIKGEAAALQQGGPLLRPAVLRAEDPGVAVHLGLQVLVPVVLSHVVEIEEVPAGLQQIPLAVEDGGGGLDGVIGPSQHLRPAAVFIEQRVAAGGILRAVALIHRLPHPVV